MSEQLDKKSILEMSMGAILERVDYEMGKVIDNILDVNTKPTAKRKFNKPTNDINIIGNIANCRNFS